MPKSTKERLSDEGLAIVERREDIPQFRNEEEEHQFWSTHTLGDGFEFQPVPEEGDDVLPPARKGTNAVSLRLENDVLYRLRLLAARRKVGYQTLAKRFIAERVYEEEKREGFAR
jgi:hypothetical protein